MNIIKIVLDVLSIFRNDYFNDNQVDVAKE